MPASFRARARSRKRVARADLTPRRVAAYAGTFYSDELDTLYTISSRDGRLFVRYPRGESELKPTITDVFEAESPFGTINYQCSPASRCDTFTVTNARVRRPRFNRVDLNPVGAQRGSK